MFGLLAVGGDAGAAVGPWVAGAVAEAPTGAQGTLAALVPDIGGAGLLLGATFPLGVVITAMVYGITARHRVHGVRGTNDP